MITAEPNWPVFLTAAFSFLVVGIFCLTVWIWAWNYKSKRHSEDEENIEPPNRSSQWERARYSTVLLPKDRWETPSDEGRN